MTKRFFIGSTADGKQIAMDAVEELKSIPSATYHSVQFVCVGIDQLTSARLGIKHVLDELDICGKSDTDNTIYDWSCSAIKSSGRRPVDIYVVSVSKFNGSYAIGIPKRYCGIEYKGTAFTFSRNTESGVMYFDFMVSPSTYEGAPSKTDGITDNGLEQWRKFYKSSDGQLNEWG